MNQNDRNNSNESSFAVSFILLLLLGFVYSTPVIIEYLNRPEQLFSRAGKWHVVNKSASKSVWKATDGLSANYINAIPTHTGFEVILQPTELSTREAYFNEASITTDTFALSVEVNTPADCHNGLVFRGNQLGEYYLFLVSSTSTYTVEILKRESGHDLPREAIIPNTAVADSIGQPQTLAIVGEKDTYYFYINGAYVNQMSDSRFGGDRVGVEVFT